MHQAQNNGDVYNDHSQTGSHPVTKTTRVTAMNVVQFTSLTQSASSIVPLSLLLTAAQSKTKVSDEKVSLCRLRGSGRGLPRLRSLEGKKVSTTMPIFGAVKMVGYSLLTYSA